eukprot:TRINITY_DN33634_c0_g1_i1.p1 TRINITY_DN33634_c0_g1~~TRINITY_DN33634_c0_g1_i1.p1  ORF type:complete len:274 (+),score=68.08 TRINITY_DN33634_c0_g1_i1:97-918(+)
MGPVIDGAAEQHNVEDLLAVVNQQNLRIEELEQCNEALEARQKQSEELINMLETLREQERQLRENGEELARDEARGAAGGSDVKQLEDIIEAQDAAIQDQLRTIEDQSAIIEELHRQLQAEGYTPAAPPDPASIDHSQLPAAPRGMRSATPTKGRQAEPTVGRRSASGPSASGLPSGAGSQQPRRRPLPPESGMSSFANSTTTSLGSTGRSRTSASSVLTTPSSQRRPRPMPAGGASGNGPAGYSLAGGSPGSAPARTGPRQSDAYNPSMRER